MKYRFFFAIFTFLLSATHMAHAADWTVDSTKSRLGFSGVQTGAPFSGTFSRYTAAIAFDPAHPETAHIDVAVDLNSAMTGDRQRDTALPGTDWFNTAAFPTAKFQTTTVHKTGGNSYTAYGTLTIRGVTRPVVLTFSLETDGKIAHAKGHADLVRTAFGVGQGPWSSGQWVALAVGVDIDIVAGQSK